MGDGVNVIKEISLYLLPWLNLLIIPGVALLWKIARYVARANQVYDTLFKFCRLFNPGAKCPFFEELRRKGGGDA